MSQNHDTNRRCRFLAVALTMPTLGSALGLDGGAIFQIVAVENLMLDPITIGLAFAMGVLSVPVQVLAAHLPLWRARRHLQLFLLFAAMACSLLALLVGFGVSGGRLSFIALGVTIVAEIALSVLYAPSWQPLLNNVLTSKDRQVVNSRGRAAGGLIVAIVLIIFGSGNTLVRTVILSLIGGIALFLALSVRNLPTPQRSLETAFVAPKTKDGPPIPRNVKLIIFILGVCGLAGAWPLFLVYAHDVLWPAANLGFLGAVQLGGSLMAAASWKPTASNPIRLAQRSSWILIAATFALAFVSIPVTTRMEEVIIVVAVFAASASMSKILIALLECAHQEVDNENSVRAFTILDVVASTSLQVGLLVGGFLTSVSAHHVDWLLEPYRIWILIGAVTMSLTLHGSGIGSSVQQADDGHV